jgi:hypothetical protein
MKQLSNWFGNSVMLPLVPKQDTEALKSFAITMGVAFPAVFMLLLPWVFNAAMPTWPLYVKLLYYPYLVWMIIASILGFINTRLILAIAYYLLIVPTGLFMQWRKGLQYKQFDSGKSAWIKRETLPSRDNLKEPF